MRMKPWIRSALAAAVTAAVLAGCGGGDGDGGGSAPSYTRLVSFGDSLSDVGTYRTAGVRAAFPAGAGQFTVNTPQGTGTNWTEQLAGELALAAPCPARTGLTPPPGGATVLAEVPRTHTDRGCTNWAQGGSRVTAPIGPGNAALFTGDPQSSAAVGTLTEPLTTQVANHLAAYGNFAATDLVTVLAGGNDAFVQIAALGAGTATAAQAGAAMQQAGTELAALVRAQLLDKGAQRVVLVLLPDIGVSPLGLSRPVEVREGFTRLSLAFNLPLLSAFSADPRVLVVDAFTASELQALDPARYGLANSTSPACDLTRVSNSLFCSAATLTAPDVSRYWFADTVHLTPYGYQLLARTVTDAMTKAGWLAPYGQRPCNGSAGATCTLAPLP